MKKCEKIKQYLKGKGIKCQDIAKDIGCHYAYLSGMMTGRLPFNPGHFKNFKKFIMYQLRKDIEEEQKRRKEIEDLLKSIEKEIK